MLKFACPKCNGEYFKVNRRNTIIQCSCGKKLIWKNGFWEELSLKQAIIECFDECKDAVIDRVVEVQETIGQWRKRLGADKWKPKITIPQKNLADKEGGLKLDSGADRSLSCGMMPTDSGLKTLRDKWAAVIFQLEKPNGAVQFNHLAHYGKLRGCDIARAAHRDLKRLGIETKITFCKDGAKLESA